ncbi:MAG: TIR domain-containing protein [Methylotenera sp.]|uniref:TIR domain-containing protein n=1 Tax=Methylotenera sp. TaxID=2051956 RepID=UPI0018501DDE|nr:TIR domain-containing protein [Methylotenera sp.]NOU24137.1 TIR domain-containing protein [Methylotenera sp.]
MARKVFYSFHYSADSWRASKVRNIGVIEGNQPAKDNDWESITKGGDKKIEAWIAEQMNGRTCTVILAGKETANRKWINHEIVKSWDKGLGVLVIYIHNITNHDDKQTTKGANPLDYVIHGPSKAKLSTIAKSYDPPKTVSADVYNYIAANIEKWIEDAITIRKANI